ALRREYFPETEAKVFAELLDLFAADGVLELRDESECRPGSRPALEGRLGDEFETLAAMYASAGNAPTTPSEAVAGLDLKESDTSSLFELLVERERLVRVDEDLYFARATYRKLVTEICHAIEREGPLAVAEIRNLLGTSRKYVVPLHEHL